MPDWVKIELNASGMKDDLDCLLEFTAGVDERGRIVPFSFFAIIPPPFSPKEALAAGRDVYSPEGLASDWFTSSWGVKWDASDVKVSWLSTPAAALPIEGQAFAEAAVSFSFLVAWDAPTPIFLTLSEKFPSVAFHASYLSDQGWGGFMQLSCGRLVAQESFAAPESHREAMVRLGYCWCTLSAAAFSDCWDTLEALEAAGEIETLQVIERLAPRWHGTLDDLVTTSIAMLQKPSR